MKKGIKITLMVTIAIAVGVGVAYAWENGEFAYLTAHDTTTLLDDVVVGTTSLAANLTVANGNIDVLEDSKGLHFSGDESYIEFDQDSFLLFNEGGYILSRENEESELGAFYYTGKTLPNDTGAETNFTSYLRSEGFSLSFADSGALLMGDYSGSLLENTGTMLVSWYPDSYIPRAIVRAAYKAEGYLPIDGPVASMEVADGAGNVKGSVRVLGNETGDPCKVRMGNSTGAEISIQPNGDLVFQIGDLN